MNKTKWLFFVVVLIVSGGLVFCATGCTVKLVQLSPDDQMQRDLEIYQKGYDEGNINGYNQGTEDTLEMMQFLEDFMNGEFEELEPKGPEEFY